MLALPTITSEGKQNTKAVSGIGRMFSNTGTAMVSSFQRNTTPSRRRIARPESSTLSEKMDAAVQKQTQGLDYKFVKKAFDIYINLANNIKKTVNDLIQKVKTILGIQNESASLKAQTRSPIPQQSTEQLRETAEAQQEQVSLQMDQNKTLIDIKVIMEKILKKIGTGGSGEDSGGGLLSTAADAAILASTLRRGGKAGALSRVARVAAGGKLGALAKVRGASAPITTAAKAIDTTTKAATGTKAAITGTASKAGSKALSLLGFGTALGAAGSAAPAIAQSVAPVAAGIQNIPGQGFVMQPPSTPTTSPAQLLSTPASTTAQAAAAAPKPGFFGRMLQTAKNIGTGAVGMVKQLGQGGLELAKAIKNPMAFLKGPGKNVILPALKRVPLLGTAIEGIIGYLNIPAIQQDPNLTPEQKKEAIGAELGKRMGSLIGTTIGSAVGLVGGPLGSILGGVIGTYGGEYVGNLIAEAIGPKEVYEFAASVPGIGDWFKKGVEKPTTAEGQTPTAKVETPSLKETVAPTPSIAPTAAFESTPTASLSPAQQSTTGEAVRYQTQQNMNNDLMQTPVSAANTQPVIINNNYYNNGTKMMPMGQSGGTVVDGAAIPPDESGMAAALTRDVARSSGFGVHV
jgi:hypothetical protein